MSEILKVRPATGRVAACSEDTHTLQLSPKLRCISGLATSCYMKWTLTEAILNV